MGPDNAEIKGFHLFGMTRLEGGEDTRVDLFL